MSGPIGLRRVFLALAASLALAGCFKVSNSLPADAPAYVRTYPGAAQIITVDVAGMKAVAFKAAATPDEVLAYYRTQAHTDGMAESAAPPQAGAKPGQKAVVFGDPNTPKFLVVTVQPQEQGTMVSLTYKPPAKP